MEPGRVRLQPDLRTMMSRADHLTAATARADRVDDDRLSDVIAQGVSWLLDRQADEGYWCGELEADTTLESDYILYLHVLGRTASVPKLANYIRRRQLAD